MGPPSTIKPVRGIRELRVPRISLLLALIAWTGPAGSQTSPLFSDVTESSGVALVHRPVFDVMRMGVGTGAAWIDFDQDGDLDLYVTQGEGPNALFRNDGGLFEEVAESLGATDPDHAGAGVAVADFDNDGWPDIYLANSDKDVLLRNDSGTGFVDVTATAGFPAGERERGTAAAWGDFDGDGFLDLYVANHMDLRGLSYSSQDRLYHNRGDGTFTDVSHLMGIERLSGYGFVGGWTDFDADGDADLLLINDCPFGQAGRYQPTLLFRNDGGPDPEEWVFTEVAEAAGASFCRHGMGLAVGDYNRDGWQDYYFTNIGKSTTLLTNYGGYFQDRASEAAVLVGLDPGDPGAPIRGTFSWGANFFDYDRDGSQDLFVAAGTLMLDTPSGTDPQPNALFNNLADSTFADVSAESGVDLPLKARTSITGDYDRDGDLDLLIVNIGEDIRLYRNESSPDGHFLAIKLQGTVSNRDGIGSLIVVATPDGQRQYYETRSGSSLGGGDESGAYFGLGESTTADTVEVRWPSGEVTTLADVAADQFLTITESESTDASREVLPRESPSLAVYPSPSRSSANVEFRIPRESGVTVEVFDVTGRRVARLADDWRTAGVHLLTWNGLSDDGSSVASGLYVIRLHVGRSGRSISLPHIQF